MSTTRQRSGRKGSAPAKKKSYGPSANAQGQSVDASQHIERITELLKDNRASVQLKGFDFVNVSDEQINQMFHNNSLNFTAPPLHYRREVTQLRHWSSNKLGKEEMRLILEEADNYDIVISASSLLSTSIEVIDFMLTSRLSLLPLLLTLIGTSSMSLDTSSSDRSSCDGSPNN